MKALLSCLLMLSISLNIYLDWQRDTSWLKQWLFIQTHTANVQPNTANVINTEKYTQQLRIRAEQAFNDGNWQHALSLLAQLNEHSSHQGQQLQHSWFVYIDEQLSDISIQRAQEYLDFIKQFLYRLPEHQSAAQLEAELLVAIEQYDEAIERYYKIFNYHPIPTIKQRLTQLIEHQINLLKKANQWTALHDKSYIWLAYQPDNMMLHKALIDSLINTHAYRDALIYIEQLPLSISEQQPIITRINTIHEQLYGPEKIALTKHGQHFILNALLNDSTIELMIDTGASITSITQAQFAQLGSGVKFKKQITVNTANGRTQAYMYTLDTFTIGKRQFKEFDILVMNENVQGRGLLGMNFLQHFAFEIEQNKAQLILKSK